MGQRYFVSLRQGKQLDFSPGITISLLWVAVAEIGKRLKAGNKGKVKKQAQNRHGNVIVCLF